MSPSSSNCTRARVAFHTALYDRSLESLGRSQRERLDANMRSEEARYQAGTVDRGALAAATLQARELDPQIEEAQHAYGAAILQLATAMGGDLGPGAQSALARRRTRNFSRVNSAARRTRPPLHSSAAPISSSRGCSLGRAAKMSASSRPVIIRGSSSRFSAATFPRPELVAKPAPVPRSARTTSSPRKSARARATPGACSTTAKSAAPSLQRARAARDQRTAIAEARARASAANWPRCKIISARSRRVTIRSDRPWTWRKIISRRWRRAGSRVSRRNWNFAPPKPALLATRRGLLDTAFQQNVALAEWDRATGRYFQFTDENRRERA